jgi:hypothetical protein
MAKLLKRPAPLARQKFFDMSMYVFIIFTGIMLITMAMDQMKSG